MLEEKCLIFLLVVVVVVVVMLCALFNFRYYEPTGLRWTGVMLNLSFGLVIEFAFSSLRREREYFYPGWTYFVHAQVCIFYGGLPTHSTAFFRSRLKTAKS